jgi:hypothetical protein
VLDVIEFLVTKSNNILWYDNENEEQVVALIAQLRSENAKTRATLSGTEADTA